MCVRTSPNCLYCHTRIGKRTERKHKRGGVKSMSIELSLLVVVIAFVALVVAIIFSLVYVLGQIKQLIKTAHQVEQELTAVTTHIKPLIEHTDMTVQTINESMAGGVAIVKSSKHITQSVAFTLQAIQEVTHNMAQRAEARLKDEATGEQVQLTMQWADIVMQAVKLLQQRKQSKSE